METTDEAGGVRGDRTAGDGAGERTDVDSVAASDEYLIGHLRGLGLTEAADRLAFYAGLSEGQRHLSTESRVAGLLIAESLSFEGIPFVDLTCEDAVAVAAIMAQRARQARDEAAMPRLILPPGMH